MTADLKEVARHCMADFWSTGDMGKYDQFFHKDFINHNPSEPNVRSYEELKASLTGTFATMVIEVVPEIILVEGNYMAHTYTVKGKLKVDFMGAPAGTQFTYTGNNIVRYTGDKMVEAWWANDMLGFFTQLGFALAPAQKQPA